MSSRRRMAAAEEAAAVTTSVDEKLVGVLRVEEELRELRRVAPNERRFAVDGRDHVRDWTFERKMAPASSPTKPSFASGCRINEAPAGGVVPETADAPARPDLRPRPGAASTRAALGELRRASEGSVVWHTCARSRTEAKELGPGFGRPQW